MATKKPYRVGPRKSYPIFEMNRDQTEVLEHRE